MSYNILIVDDSAIIRTVVRKTVAMAGIEAGVIFEAGNGREALDVLEKEWVDIVFADINMPVMNGMELVEKMSEHNMMSTIPVVIISTERSEQRIEELRHRGVRAYLNKPFRPEQLKEVTDKVLGDKGESS